jgi:hypothetical protein
VGFPFADENKRDRPVILSPRNETIEADPGKQASQGVVRPLSWTHDEDVCVPSQHTHHKLQRDGDTFSAVHCIVK